MPDARDATVFLEVEIDDFDGPLDLLDRLLVRHRMPIDRISITAITDQYLAVLRAAERCDMGLASEFLLLAATLIRLKSAALLPSSDETEEAEEAGDELVFRLLRYRRCRMLAAQLETRHARYGGCYYKPPETATRLGLEVATECPPLSRDRFDAAAAAVALRNGERFRDLQQEVERILSRDRARVGDKIEALTAELVRRPRFFFYELFPPGAPRPERVAGFLALLELMRSNRVKVTQHGVFAPILIERKEA